MFLLRIGCSLTPILEFNVQGNTAIMTGDMTSNAPDKVEQLLTEYPNLEWIELLDCPGSMDDEAVYKAARMIRNAQINTGYLQMEILLLAQ